MKRGAALLVLAALLGACGVPTAWKPPTSTPPAVAVFGPYAASPTPTPSPAPSPSPGHPGPVRLITIVLSAQHLTAYEDSRVIVSTDVATGRPDLATPTGDFHLMARYSPFLFVSPWPPGDPNYYDPTWVSWAMPFAPGGYFMHDASWQRNWGPGADVTSGSHGCVNVPVAAMKALYQWAREGDEVIVSR